MKIYLCFVFAGAICILPMLNVSGAEPMPQTPKKPVTNEYQGLKVEDNYQWLEQDNDPAVKAWWIRKISAPENISTSCRTVRQSRNN
jgi:protease II